MFDGAGSTPEVAPPMYQKYKISMATNALHYSISRSINLVLNYCPEFQSLVTHV